MRCFKSGKTFAGIRSEMATRTKRKQRQSETRWRDTRIVPTNDWLAAVLKRIVSDLPQAAKSKVKIVAPDALRPAATKDTLIISHLPDKLTDRMRGTDFKILTFMQGMPPEAITTWCFELKVRSPDRWHLTAEQGEDQAQLLRRLVVGRTRPPIPHSIVDAWIEGESLVLFSPGFDRLYVPLDLLAEYLGDDPDTIAEFEIDEDGSFLYWPHGDVHLGWKQFKQLVDPTAAIAAKQRSEAFNRRYGAAIRSLREQHDITQNEIDGINPRHLRRIEKGQRATSQVLAKLAAAHDMTLNEYLAALAEEL